MSKELQWVLIAAALYIGLGLAFWYYDRAKDPRFPVAYPSMWKWSLIWPAHQFQK